MFASVYLGVTAFIICSAEGFTHVFKSSPHSPSNLFKDGNKFQTRTSKPSFSLNLHIGLVIDDSAIDFTSTERRKLAGLKAGNFQHPFDQDATKFLQRLPGLENTVRAFIPIIEEGIYLDNIANSILTGPSQLSSIHKLLLEACLILDMEPPELYVRQNPIPNAYTLAVSGKKPFIVLHTSLIDLMTPGEVQAVIAHELGHLKCEHGIWITAANILANGIYQSGFGLGRLIADSLGFKRLLQNWRITAELSCDRAALLVTQDVHVVTSVLLKLVGGGLKNSDELSTSEFLKQAQLYDNAGKSRIGRWIKRTMTSGLTHPLPVLRARELDDWARSRQYLNIIKTR
jgi:Zn-dependent protease with chaperone function